jgi:hypothetical protein
MVAVWNQKVNPWGPTGGNPMVEVILNGKRNWSYYKYPKKTPEYSSAARLPNREYNYAWNAMKRYYTNTKDFPSYDMNAEGLTLGNPLVPGFTYNSTGSGTLFTAQPPEFGVFTKPPGTGP